MPSPPTMQPSRSEQSLPEKTEHKIPKGNAPVGHRHQRKHNGGLLVIGFFKVVEAMLYVAISIGTLKLLHKDIGDLLLSTAAHLRLDIEGQFVTMLLAKAQLLTDHRLKQIGLGTMGYAAVKLVEGVGLVMEKVWAEYLTLVLSVAFLPWEFYELIRGVTTWRVLLTVSNLLIVLYLLWFLRQSRRSKRAHRA